jgi:hypothetical protein
MAVMKKILPAFFCLFLFSCSNDQSQEKIDSLKTDSALKAQTALVVPRDSVSKDTMHMVALPPVSEGDIVMQNSDDPKMVEFGNVCGSKYNHCGIIFIRPRDHMYMVAEVKDSVRLTPLTEWVDRGVGQHVALLRLKNASQVLSPAKADRLKKGGNAFRGKKYDGALSWSDDAVYSTEMVWKMYKSTLNIEICELGKISDVKIAGTKTEEVMKRKYGQPLPPASQFLSPDAIYKSPKMEVIYER